MWTILPSQEPVATSEFFSFEKVQSIASGVSTSRPLPVVRGRVWSGDERAQNWAIECQSFEEFRSSVTALAERIDFLAFDEMRLDDETLRVLHEDLRRIAEEENLVTESVAKAFSALRSHENELFSVVAYAFLTSGRVIFVRSQNELSKYVFRPERLFSQEELGGVRKLRKLDQ